MWIAPGTGIDSASGPNGWLDTVRHVCAGGGLAVTLVEEVMVVMGVQAQVLMLPLYHKY